MAEILPNSPNDVASRGVTNTTLAQFKGLARQVVINIDDGFRPVIMDGLTLGGKFFCASKAEVEAVKVTAQGALTKTQADGYYLGKNNPTFTGTLSGTNGTFTGALSLNGDSVATQSDLEELQGQISDRYENYGVLPADSSQNTYVTVQQLQSTSANLADYAGAAGQIVYNSETKKIHIMDGVTAGGIPLAFKSDVDTLESNSVKTTEQTLTEDQQTQSLKNQGVIQAITELITENGGTVPTSLSENSVQTMSEDEADPWADLE